MLHSSARALNYRLYKEELKFENYLDTLTKKMQSYFVDFEIVIITYPLKVDVGVNERKCENAQNTKLGMGFIIFLIVRHYSKEEINTYQQVIPKQKIPKKYKSSQNIMVILIFEYF